MSAKIIAQLQTTIPMLKALNSCVCDLNMDTGATRLVFDRELHVNQVKACESQESIRGTQSLHLIILVKISTEAMLTISLRIVEASCPHRI